jgi:hypothetical protein
MKDTSFTLDILTRVPDLVYENSHLSKIDDKSGYDHVSFATTRNNILAYNGVAGGSFAPCCRSDGKILPTFTRLWGCF